MALSVPFVFDSQQVLCDVGCIVYTECYLDDTADGLELTDYFQQITYCVETNTFNLEDNEGYNYGTLEFKVQIGPDGVLMPHWVRCASRQKHGKTPPSAPLKCTAEGCS